MVMGGGSEGTVGRIFISYRREDTAYPAGWLFDRLTEHFDAGQVFKDVDSIELGDDFVEAISTAVGSCDVLLALIGDQWLTITDARGRRRLEDPDDFVRVEIEAALSRNVRVIPILVDGASMPSANEIPPSLAGLVRRQALELSPSRFDFDSGRLLNVLDKTLADVRADEDEALLTAPDSHQGHPATIDPESSSPAVGSPQASAGERAPVRSGPSSSDVRGDASGRRRRRILSGGVLAAIVGLGLVIAAVFLLGGETENALEASPALFEDDFSDRSSGWKLDGGESTLGDIVDGGYRLQLEAGEGTDFVWVSPESSEELFPTTSANISVQVDARRVSGGSDPDSFGIFCRSDAEHDYRFELGERLVNIAKVDGRKYTVLESETIPARVDLDTSNDLRASCRTIEQGGAVVLEFAINGDVVADATDRDTPLLAGTVALFGFTEETLEVEFDNLIVNEV